jgi:hypothetical protein
VIVERAEVFDLLLAGRPAQLVGDGTMLVEADHPGAGLWRGAARLQVAGCVAGPWFPWAIAELPVLAALAALAGFQVADRYHAGRCFVELRHVSGR